MKPTATQPPDWILGWSVGGCPDLPVEVVGRSADGCAVVGNEVGAEAPAFRFDTGQTTVVGGHIYGDQSVDTIDRLGDPAATYGLYSAIRIDHEAGVLRVWRDHVGKTPLFWCTVDDTRYFSPSIHTLLRVTGTSADLNRALVAEHLLGRWHSREETYFRDIRRVDQGEVLSFGRSGPPQHDSFWDPASLGVDYLDEESPDEILEVFRSTFEQVIADLLDIGDPAIFLSGGLDSVSVAAVASGKLRDQEREPLLALSAVFPPPVTSEEDIQRGVADALELPQEVFYFDELVGNVGMLGHAVTYTEAAPAPVHNPWAPVYSDMSEFASVNGRTTILTGGGGDEWLGVDPVYAVELLRKGRVLAMWRLASSFRRSYSLQRVAFARNILWNNLARPAARQMAVGLADRIPGVWKPFRDRVAARRTARQQSQREWVRPDRELQAELDQRLAAVIDAQLRRPDFYFQRVFSAIGHPLIAIDHDELYYRGRRSGVLILEPFWDPRLIEFLARVPPEVLNIGGRSKGLVRQHVDTAFPELGFATQKKVSALSFFEESVSQQAKSAWERLGGVPALVDLGVVDASKAAGLIERLDSDYLLAQYAQGLLILESWVRANNTGLTPGSEVHSPMFGARRTQK